MKNEELIVCTATDLTLTEEVVDVEASSVLPLWEDAPSEVLFKKKRENIDSYFPICNCVVYI